MAAAATHMAMRTGPSTRRAPTPRAAAPSSSSIRVACRPAAARRPLTVSLAASTAAAAPASTPRIEVDLTPFPTTSFFKVEAIVRPWRVEAVIAALSRSGILGVTVQASGVSGVGAQGGRSERYGGTSHGVASLVEKSALWAVVGRDQVAPVASIIVGAARTGEQGDGKLFVTPVADVIRVRTGETGAAAERMEGGMADRLGGVGE